MNSFILEKVYESEKEQIQIDYDWLKKQVNDFHGRNYTNEIKTIVVKAIDEEDNLLKTHIDKYIELAPQKEVIGKSDLGLAENTIKTYKTFKGLIEKYEEFKGVEISFKGLDKQFEVDFKKWMLNTKEYSHNYAGKQIDYLLAMCNDAEGYGVEINEYYKKIKRFSQCKKERLIVTFTDIEIEKIWSEKMPTSSLENAKKWILIGCHLGQRAGDLLKINPQMLRESKMGVWLIDIEQEKTGKSVTIPITDERILKLIQKELPSQISIQKLNSYIKEVCLLCEINDEIQGKKFNAEIQRKVKEVYPKYQLVTSHSFRRTFATHWYRKMETSLIMSITGHSREAQFLEYIDKTDDNDKNAHLFYEKVQEFKNKRIN